LSILLANATTDSLNALQTAALSSALAFGIGIDKVAVDITSADVNVRRKVTALALHNLRATIEVTVTSSSQPVEFVGDQVRLEIYFYSLLNKFIMSGAATQTFRDNLRMMGGTSEESDLIRIVAVGPTVKPLSSTAPTTKPSFTPIDTPADSSVTTSHSSSATIGTVNANTITISALVVLVFVAALALLGLAIFCYKRYATGSLTLSRRKEEVVVDFDESRYL
jgi:hypothetical protein